MSRSLLITMLSAILTTALAAVAWLATAGVEDGAAWAGVIVAAAAALIAALNATRRADLSAPERLDNARDALAAATTISWATEAQFRGLTPKPIETTLAVGAWGPDRRSTSVSSPVNWPNSRSEPPWHPKAWLSSLTRRKLERLSRPADTPMLSPAITDTEHHHITIATMANIWRSDPVKRFVILGPPGAGKSSALVTLACDLLRHRQPGDPVPVLVSLSDWDPLVPFEVWFTSQLERDYPQLRIKQRLLDSRRTSLAAALIARGDVIPCLDGLDELAGTKCRTAALRALQENAIWSRRPLVLTCRTEEYREAGRAEFRVQGSQEFTVQPLTADQAVAYLRRNQPDSPGSDRWSEVAADIRGGGVLATVFSTPLMVFLARAAYEQTGDDAPSPSELLRSYGTVESVQRRLVDQFIQSVYQRPNVRGSRDVRRTQRIRQVLIYLASLMERRKRTEIAWSKLDDEVPSLPATVLFFAGPSLIILSGYAAATIALSLFGHSVHHDFVAAVGIVGLGITTTIALIAGSFIWLTSAFWDGFDILSLLARELVLIAIAAVACGFIVVFRALDSDLVALLLAGLGFNFAVVVLRLIVEVSGLGDLFREFGGTKATVEDYRANRREAWIYVLTLGLGLSGMLSVALWNEYGLMFVAVAAVAIAPMFGGLTLLLFDVTHLRIAVWCLQFQGRLPWGVNLIRILEDGRQRHLFRQLGGIYQFRHRIIQECLASEAIPDTGDPV